MTRPYQYSKSGMKFNVKIINELILGQESKKHTAFWAQTHPQKVADTQGWGCPLLNTISVCKYHQGNNKNEWRELYCLRRCHDSKW